MGRYELRTVKKQSESRDVIKKRRNEKENTGK
jgi:hypothetical protein